MPWRVDVYIWSLSSLQCLKNKLYLYFWITLYELSLQLFNLEDFDSFVDSFERQFVVN